MLAWLIQGAVGPALVALPVSWAASALAGAAAQWFRRLRRSDELSRIVRAASGGGLGLSDGEFAAIRHLLEDERTWIQVGHATVEDLAVLIASCMPGRPGDGALVASRAIARGLLEFAIHDLDPGLFQQVLFARLERLETDQATELDMAIFGVHADLAARFAQQEDADVARTAQVLRELGRVLDRIPPGPANRDEVAIYLAVLIRWLNLDPWPQDNRFAGHVLTPAAIERKLRIVDHRRHGEDLDADDLARRCTRLVVLGGPGSGKTWLARRTARLAAAKALDGLATGAAVDEVELPLYTTCSQLLAARGDIRRAVASSGLDQLPDLGSSRVAAALRVFFAERNAPTVLVIDSLDEASGPDDRLRQADTLPLPWRIVLTSRPASWNHQLVIGETGQSCRVGVLQPLRYPNDVEPFIRRWFSQRPAWGDSLARQLARRPALQEAATVPLILAFYCIIGGDQPLPGRRSELYSRVIRRMLTGRWRDSTDHEPDADRCLEILRDWAWAGASRSPVSGVGNWADEIPVPRVRLSQADREALDHVAAAVGPRNADTGTTARRFTHRSLREHLVAEHVALRMSAADAAAELLNHIWYDPDWEYAAPGAVAMHPNRDEVLKDLVRRVIDNHKPRADLSAFDGCWQFRQFLARVAWESSEGDWAPEVAEVIGQARVDLVASRGIDQFRPVETEWATSDGLSRDALLALLTQATELQEARRLAGAAAMLNPTAEDRTRIRGALLGLLARATHPGMARGLAVSAAELDLTAQERAQARAALLGQLTRAAHPAMARGLAAAFGALDPTPEERAQAHAALLDRLTRAAHPAMARGLAAAFAALDPTAEERAQAHAALLDLAARATDRRQARELAGEAAKLNLTMQERTGATETPPGRSSGVTDPPQTLKSAAAAGLNPARTAAPTARQRARSSKARKSRRPAAEETSPELTAQEREQAREALPLLLASDHRPGESRELVAAARLGPMTGDPAQLREALLNQLTRESDLRRASELAAAVLGLEPAVQDRMQVRQALLRLLNRATRPSTARQLATAIAELALTAHDRAEVLAELFAQLSREARPMEARELATAIAGIAVTAQERAEAREALLAQMSRSADPWEARGLADAVASLDPTAQDRATAREALLGRLSCTLATQEAGALTAAVAGLAVTAQDRADARAALLGQLSRSTDHGMARALATAIAGLDPTATDRTHAREALLAKLSRPNWPWQAWELTSAIAGLTVTAEDRAEARAALLGQLSRPTNHNVARALAAAIAGLDPTATDQAQIREALLRQLARAASPVTARELAITVTGLAPTATDQAQARGALLALLARERHTVMAHNLAEIVLQLHPTVADLADWHSWIIPLSPELLAAVRRNSTLVAWLSLLPSLYGLPVQRRSITIDIANAAESAHG